MKAAIKTCGLAPSIGRAEKPPPESLKAIRKTIEIGLVVIDLETLEIVDEFQRFVRPQINPFLTDFCKELTSIQQRTWTVQGKRPPKSPCMTQADTH